MGNYKFRLSDMMPNAWFYKLRDMNNSTTRKQNTSHPINKKLPSTTTTKSQKPNLSHHPTKHYYYYYNYTTEPTRVDKFQNSPTNPKVSDTHFPDPPRKSSKKKRNKRKTIYKPSSRLVTSSVSADDCTSVWTKPEPTPRPQDYFISPKQTSPEIENDYSHGGVGSPSSSEFESDTIDAFWSSSCSCRVSSSTADIIIDMNEKSYTSRKFDILEDYGFDPISELELPPILTKPADNKSRIPSKLKEEESEEIHESVVSIKIVKEDDMIKSQKETKTRKTVSYSTGVKLRATNSRLANKKIQSHGRKSVSSSTNSKASSRMRSYSESFAIVKSSFDPQKDFRDSMMEMIVENNIKDSKDLEELLACYLSLNSDEYHDLIVKAFEQIWYDMKDIHM